MTTMTAFRMVEWERPPQYQEIPVPEPGPGDVRVKIAGVGLCHTDIHFLHARTGAFPYDPPFTLGHENGGWVDEVGAGVIDLEPGTPVLVALGPRCSRCAQCLSGRDNLCLNRTSGRGWGKDGGLAEYLVVPRRELVTLSTLDPRVDTAPHRLSRARELGADDAIESHDDVAGVLRELTGGPGAEAVFDFVGTDATLTTALSQTCPGGTLAIVGAEGGSVAVGWASLPPLCEIFIPFGGTTADLHAVVALAETGKLQMDVQLFPFTDVADACARVESGELTGRAVVTLD